MGGQKGEVDGAHSATVYAERGYIAVAWLRSTDGAGGARAVLNVRDKTWVSIYGDVTRLKPLLESRGYSRSDNGLLGLTLNKIECGNSYLMPYIDGAQGLIDIGDGFKVVVGDCEHTASGLNGMLSGSSICGECGSAMNDDESRHVENTGVYICASCADLDDDFQHAIGDYGNTYLVDRREEEVYYYESEAFTQDGLAWSDLVLLDTVIVNVSDCVVDHASEEYILIADAVGVWDSSCDEIVYMSDESAEYNAHEIPSAIQDRCEDCEYYI